jgi:hypothetical protein
MSVPDFLRSVPTHQSYWWMLGFFAFYPVVSAITWVTTGLHFYLRREREKDTTRDVPPVLARYPRCTVLIPAYCEEKVIAETLTCATEIDYPDFEIVVVDDASTDGTVEAVRPFVESGRVRLIAKHRNEGKAMAMNDALPCIQGEIVLIMDADAAPDPMILKWMVPHFESPRVAGVTGNPRVRNRETYLAQLQMIEFTSIVSLLRRAQRIWGRVLTMSGVVGAFRTSALLDAGRYSSEMATEDIDMTWKLPAHVLRRPLRAAGAGMDEGAAHAARAHHSAQALGDGAGAGAAPLRQRVGQLAGAPAVAGVHRILAVDSLGILLRHPHRVLDRVLLLRHSADRRLAHPELVGHDDRYVVHHPAPDRRVARFALRQDGDAPLHRSR